MKLKATFLAAPLLLAAALPANAEWNDSIRYRAEAGFSLAAGDHNPFWLAANRNGFATTQRNNLYLRLGAFKDMNKEKRFDWGAGIDMGVGHRYQSTFLPQQLYAEVQYRCLDAMIGAKELHDPIVPADLSSGALTMSENAHPIPQIRVGIFDYAGFWGCNEWFAVKGHIAYGMFDDNWWINRWVDKKTRYSLNTLYSSKAIYFRGGDARKFPLEGELGLCMDTQFGGKTWYPNASEEGGGHWHKNPTDFKAFVKALVPLGGDSSTSAGEQNNVQGNMLGNWSFSLKWADPSGWMVKLYYQHYFEDHSMLFFDYPWKDGLYGVQGKLPKNPVLSEAVYEFLYMKDQSGPVYWDHTSTINHQVSGRDEYYDHYIYNGWQQWGMGLGNPLMISPVYNKNHHLYFYNTRVRAHHFGLKGEPSQQVSWRMLGSYTQSWGTYNVPLDKVESNFSFLAEVKYHPAKLKGWEGCLQFAFDAGSLLGHSYGVSLSVAKTGFFK